MEKLRHWVKGRGLKSVLRLWPHIDKIRHWGSQGHTLSPEDSLYAFVRISDGSGSPDGGAIQHNRSNDCLIEQKLVLYRKYTLWSNKPSVCKARILGFSNCPLNVGIKV
ncbi:hypothetical protein AVEN_260064-1 [Araneus ventricosus]|uniref:Uncharacterized protein n=1 Tax=Araneus ventricosus TaxID=182803 RepID=A0A4Y2G4Q4_ARAVE|nr:hypothetical protein AVEN_260064-1 [Araneus ventricosus]